MASNPQNRRDIADVVTRAVLAFTGRGNLRRRSFLRWLAPSAATLFVALVQYAVFPEPSIAPFVFFYFGIALSAGLGGRGPGLVAVLLSAAVANYVFMAPRWAVSDTRPAVAATGLFLIGGTLVALVCAAFRTSLLRLDDTARELRRAEEALRESEQRVRGMFDKAAAGIVEVGARNELLAVNERLCEMLGYRRDELLGRTILDLTAPEDLAVTAEVNADVREGRRDRVDYEKRYLRRDGARLWVHVAVTALRDGAGTFRGAIGTVEDITRRKAAEAERDRLIDELREANRRKTDFLGILSHELRNPLAPIRNSLYILRRAAQGGEQVRRALAVIERQVQHTTRLVDDLLDVTRITRGKVRIHRERLDLGELARRTAEDHRELFAKSGVRLAVHVSGGPVVVNADPTRIVQVFGNLLQNAAKFSHGGGETTLRVERSGGFAVVTVRDTGAGIPPDVLGRLFEPFVQADSTLDRSTGGLGLGLALVKGLAELHGGSVSAHSEGPGRGATFVVRLPLERRRDPRPPTVAASAAPRAARRVVVIEDNVDAAESLKEALELNDHVVDVALSGPEGLEKVRALKPDLVLCDIGLPGIDGFEVARRIRADPEVADVALIALSGYAQPEDLERSREAGFDLHLAKPPHLDALERAMAWARGSRPRAPPAPASAAPAGSRADGDHASGTERPGGGIGP